MQEDLYVCKKWCAGESLPLLQCDEQQGKVSRARVYQEKARRASPRFLGRDPDPGQDPGRGMGVHPMKDPKQSLMH